MKRTVARALVLVFAIAALAVGAQALAAKLPKCAAVKCQDIGCPADVLCVSGSKVITCAQHCGGGN